MLECTNLMPLIDMLPNPYLSFQHLVIIPSSDVSSMTKSSDAPSGQGLMANPELSNILKNSLYSQVNVSIGTAGVLGGETGLH